MKTPTLRDARLFVEAIIFTVLVPGAVTVLIPAWILGSEGRRLPQAWTPIEVIALLPLALGAIVYVWCLWDFAARGRGIPAPIDHPKRLVVTGLYRYVRNPMYLGVLLVLAGETVLFGSWPLLFYAVSWFLIVNIAVRLYEEPALRRRFPASYPRYKAEVGRWIPRLRPRPRD